MTEPEVISTPTPEDKPQSVSDWFRKTVTLPQDTIEIFTDARTAYEYTELVAKQDEIGRRLNILRAKQQARDDFDATSIADIDPMHDEILTLAEQDDEINNSKQLLMEDLNKTAVSVTMRALYPAEVRLVISAAERAHPDKDGKTASDVEIETYRNRSQNALYLEKSVTAMRTAAGEELNLPTPAEWMAIEDTLDSEQWVRLINKMTQLNVRAAIKDARTDAGFLS